jgi:hypothetical protein
MESLILILGALGAILLHLIASEIYSRASGLAKHLINRAARNLAPSVRLRYEEEWLAHLDHCTGNLAKLLHGIGCYACARKLQLVSSPQRVPTATDVFPIEIQGKVINSDVSTAACVLKQMRTILQNSRGSKQDLRPLTAVIESLERRFVLGSPSPDMLAEIHSAFGQLLREARDQHPLKPGHDSCVR